MRRFIAILGTLLIAVVIIISGSAVATWVYVTVYSSNSCTDITDIEAAEDNVYASLGQDGPPPVLGWVLLDLGSVNEMPSSQDFTVFADTSVEENYSVWVGITNVIATMSYVGQGSDLDDEIFQTPSQPAHGGWQYIYILGTSGIAGAVGGDYAYGPDIDAVGWDKP
jgi:hypothetical protein